MTVEDKATTDQSDSSQQSWSANNGIRKLITEIKKLEYPDERSGADSVLQLAMANNKEIFEELKGENGMCQALRELMADEIQEEMMEVRRKGLAEGLAEGKQEGAKTLFESIKRLQKGETIEMLKNAGVDQETLHMATAVLHL